MQFPHEIQKLRRALRGGTGFVDGKGRVTEKYKENPTTKEFAEFLKKEFGIGGRTFEDGFVDYSSKGFTVYEKGWDNKKLYSWSDVAKEITDMLKTNQY